MIKLKDLIWGEGEREPIISVNNIQCVWVDGLGYKQVESWLPYMDCKVTDISPTDDEMLDITVTMED